MGGLLAKARRFASSPQGKRAIGKAMDYAKSPKGRAQLEKARGRFARGGGKRQP